VIALYMSVSVSVSDVCTNLGTKSKNSGGTLETKF
jgi:hypothetical protein